jgi:hypothetical protein
MSANMMYDTYLKEFSGVLIAVIYADAASKDSDIKSDAEVSWEHWASRTVLLQDHLALKEHALRGATICLARLADHN